MLTYMSKVVFSLSSFKIDLLCAAVLLRGLSKNSAKKTGAHIIQKCMEAQLNADQAKKVSSLSLLLQEFYKQVKENLNFASAATGVTSF